MCAYRRVVEVEASPHPGAYEIAVASQEAERTDHFSLRYQSYQEHGMLDPDRAFENGLEQDPHDAHAALFNARNLRTGRLHAVARLVFDVGGRLPMEEYYSLEGFRRRVGWYDSRQALAEFSRLISHPIGQKALNRELVRSVFTFALQNGVEYILGAGRVEIRHYYDKWGFHDVEPGHEIVLPRLGSVLKLYPHYMHVSEIRWDRI